MRKARSQSSVARLWIRPFGDRTPALLIRTSRRPNRSTAKATAASTAAKSLTSASVVSTDPALGGSAATVASSDGATDVAQQQIGVGLAGELPRHRRTERASGSCDGNDPTW